MGAAHPVERRPASAAGIEVTPNPRFATLRVQEAGGQLGAQATQAVPTMLELVPRGVDKWVGLQQLMADLGIPRQAIMGVGDGGNDLTLVQNAGLGVAMGNAVPAVGGGRAPRPPSGGLSLPRIVFTLRLLVLRRRGGCIALSACVLRVSTAPPFPR